MRSAECQLTPFYHDSVDPVLLQHMIDSEAEFIMEVTDKTKADIKVGALSICPFAH